MSGSALRVLPEREIPLRTHTHPIAMGAYASKLMEDIGDGRTFTFELNVLNVTLNAFLQHFQDIPITNLHIIEQSLIERYDHYIQTPEHPRVHKLRARRLNRLYVLRTMLQPLMFSPGITSGSKKQWVSFVKTWLGRNKCFAVDVDADELLTRPLSAWTRRCTDTNHFMVTKKMGVLSPQSSKVHPGDVLIRVNHTVLFDRCAQLDERVQSDLNMDLLRSKGNGCSTASILLFRKANSLECLVRSLPSPPSCVKMVLWGKKACFITRKDSKGAPHASIDIAPVARYIIKQLAQSGILYYVFNEPFIPKDRGFPRKGYCVEHIQYHLDRYKLKYQQAFPNSQINNSNILYFSSSSDCSDAAYDLGAAAVHVRSHQMCGMSLGDWEWAMDIVWEYQQTGVLEP